MQCVSYIHYGGKYSETGFLAEKVCLKSWFHTMIQLGFIYNLNIQSCATVGLDRTSFWNWLPASWIVHFDALSYYFLLYSTITSTVYDGINRLPKHLLTMIDTKHKSWDFISFQDFSLFCHALITLWKLIWELFPSTSLHRKYVFLYLLYFVQMWKYNLYIILLFLYLCLSCITACFCH